MAAQLPDIIIINGKQLDLYSNPLEEYWSKSRKRKPSFYKLMSCHRGYIATWEIKDKQLFLLEVRGRFLRRILFFFRKISRFSIRNLFRKVSSQGIKAGWFSGKLRVPSGPMTMYEDNGYDSRFENELIITVEKGNVIKMVSLDYTQQRLTTHPADF